MRLLLMTISFLLLYVGLKGQGSDDVSALKIEKISRIRSNSFGADICPVIYNNGIVFSSDRRDRFTSPDKKPYFDMYYMSFDPTREKTGAPKSFANELNTLYNDGPVSFTPDGKNIYVSRNVFTTRGKSKKRENRLMIIIAEAEGRRWKNIKEFPFNNEKYSVGHPAFSNDGATLYFTSDMPGGYGETDIYRTVMVEGEWSKPENLGPDVNTKMKEMFPYVDNRGNLFFASEGHKGYGMLDMYLADRKGGGYNILNLGPQLNSKFDDFGLSIDNEYKYALFSSNRNGGKGSDDIYYAALDKNVLSGTGDDNVLSGTVDDNVLSGTVVSSINKKPLKDAIVYVYKGNELIEELHTSGNGYFEFNTSHPGTFNVTAHKVFYKKNSVEIEVGKSRSNSKVNVPLTPVFIVKGKVTDIDSRLLVPQTIVSLVCDDAVIQYVKADNDGDYRIEISPDKEYSFEFIRFGYISFRKEVSTEGKLPGILNLDIELKSVENRDMFVLEGVYYDYNGWNIREDARPVLHRLVELMKQNPQLKVELSSHSDSRGSNEYNLILSQRRAEAIIEFLWMKGIPNSRVSIIANGEKYLIFRTGDEDLSEDKHQANRRTEIRLYF